MRPHLIPLAMTLPALTAGPVRAAEVCVVCSEPAATYRCMVDTEKVQFSGVDKVVQFMCAKELAKAGKHASCKAVPGTGPACLGEQRTVGLQGVEGQPEPGSPEAAAAEAKRAEALKNAPPKTLVELAKRTNEQMNNDAKSAGEAVGNAGDAVGGAMKKTWRCLSTLFTGC
jgi:hypothetical protein